ncbi:MAG: hypothetical protein ACE5E1_01065 [Phycisphaerae bacterium]
MTPRLRIHVRWLAALAVLATAGPAASRAQPESPRRGRRAAAPNPEVLADKALKKIDSGDFKEAATLLAKARRLKPTMNKLNLVEGLLLVATEQGAQAIKPLEDYNASDEGRVDHRGFAAVASVYAKSRMYSQALYSFEQAIKYAPLEKQGVPVRARLKGDLAKAYAGLGQTKKAVETAKGAASDAPNDGETQLRLGEIAAAANDTELLVKATDRAITLFKKRIRDDSFNEDAHESLLRCYELVTSLYRYYIRTDADNGEHYYQFGKILVERTEVDRRITLLKAREQALQAVEKDPKNATWQLFVAKLELELGAVSAAKDRLAAVLRDHPNNAEAKELEQRLGSAPAALP